jgi:hypothetical protein
MLMPFYLFHRDTDATDLACLVLFITLGRTAPIVCAVLLTSFEIDVGRISAGRMTLFDSISERQDEMRSDLELGLETSI